MNQIIPISSAKFVYVDSARTNIRERFDRIRNEQKLVVENVLAAHVAARVLAWSKK